MVRQDVCNEAFVTERCSSSVCEPVLLVIATGFFVALRCALSVAWMRTGLAKAIDGGSIDILEELVSCCYLTLGLMLAEAYTRDSDIRHRHLGHVDSDLHISSAT